jgi:DNA mismatch endonuclease (patch repair protein)
MRAVKSVNTEPELQVRKILSGDGYRYRLHRKDLPGTPDIVFPGRKKVIFVHGCFWHQHSCKRGNRQPQANKTYWDAKLQRNIERDANSIRDLLAQGWKSIVVWECELKDPNAVHQKLTAFLSA